MFINYINKLKMHFTNYNFIYQFVKIKYIQTIILN